MTILDKLAEYAFERVKNAKEILSADEVKYMALSMADDHFEFENALSKDGMSFICECKKASPSKGIIAEDFQHLKIAKDYEKAGADCISVLTEPKWFLGCDKFLYEIANEVILPCLRKDFVVDEYYIYQAKIMRAKAVLLICSILSPEQLKEYIGICDELGISALVETHNPDEIKMAVNAGARVIGVNNRNLNDFSVDTENSRRLRELVPENIIFVAESGIQTASDVADLRNAGVDAVLIGETLMRAKDKTEKLKELKGLL